MYHLWLEQGHPEIWNAILGEGLSSQTEKATAMTLFSSSDERVGHVPRKTAPVSSGLFEDRDQSAVEILHVGSSDTFNEESKFLTLCNIFDRDEEVCCKDRKCSKTRKK